MGETGGADLLRARGWGVLRSTSPRREGRNGGTPGSSAEAGAPRHPQARTRPRVARLQQSRERPSFGRAQVGAPSPRPSVRTRPVLLEECLDWLALPTRRDRRRRHASAAAATPRRSSSARRPTARLIGLDRDPEALAAVAASGSPLRRRASQLVHASFRELREVLARARRRRASTACCSTSASRRTSSTRRARGFRFAADERGETPLDMRMDPERGRRPRPTCCASAAPRRARATGSRDYGELPRRAPAGARARRRAPARARSRTAADLLARDRAARGSAAAAGTTRRRSSSRRCASRSTTSSARSTTGSTPAIDALAPGGRARRDRLPLARGPHREARASRAASAAASARRRLPVCVCGRPAAAARADAPRGAAGRRGAARATRARARRGCAPPSGWRRPHERVEPAQRLRRAIWSAATRARAADACARLRAAARSAGSASRRSPARSGSSRCASRSCASATRSATRSQPRRQLLEQQRQHQALLETLRDPTRLAALAQQRGFGAPERVLELRARADRVSRR